MEVEKMNLLKKVTAALSAVVMMTGAVSAIPTCAIGLGYDTTSAFQYELETYRLSDTRVGLKFHVTNNPGVSGIAFAIMFDDDCSYVSWDNDESMLSSMYTPSETEPYFIMACLTMDSDIYGKARDITSNFSYFFEFEVPSDAAYPLHFSSSVYSYKSQTENISFDHAKTGPNSPDYTPDPGSQIGVKLKDVPYRIGDVDGDNKITMDDSLDILQIARYGKNNLSVDDLNEYLIKHSYCQGARKAWSEAFPKLTYAECADANQDGSIKPEDSDEVMEYYSQAAASNITMSTLVNSMGYKKVTYEY